MTKQPEQVPLDEALGRHREELKQLFPMPPSRSAPSKAVKSAGITLAVAIAFAALAWLNPAYKSERFSTAIGERRAVLLSDGSKLLLDSGTHVDISWRLLSREVDLRAGQVLFDVSSAVYRPFVVSAGIAKVEVLGTLFNVRRLDNDAVRVTLARGRVDVTAAAAQAPVTLTPGQQVDSIGGQLMPVAKADASKAMAWKDDRIVFEQTPLDEAVSLLRHYRKAPIELSDPSLAALKVTGVFEARNVDLLLDLLPSILPVAVLQVGDGSVRIQRKPTRK
ncbi:MULTISPECIES: FecR family protein [Pseudomonas]|jgi:ferric-dicitrate binding protein FerR (iron transport regulator)|uniref:Iron dicitrate transport regulator FecR n=3 Tax=Pseudomonas TaxID=286 RepID=A0A099N004_PSEDL|nr:MULTISPECIES: FecR domain-containing protein [Pseudomonas]AEJ12856.1 putative transmembrane sensor [Pseudomonas putida S16]AHC82253.1 iron dicitrate transporter FecR [Pseudomonas monteilii SB3078]AHC87631.1 iron dicitrate transporter FecR [Pseudomonas monteilii SB3101]AHZ77066.1 transmembrane sensor [Pseudomonas putida]AJG14041.1 putative transmembrane sensor [Pseudomonas plecoglossicida]